MPMCRPAAMVQWKSFFCFRKQSFVHPESFCADTPAPVGQVLATTPWGSSSSRRGSTRRWTCPSPSDTSGAPLPRGAPLLPPLPTPIGDGKHQIHPPTRSYGRECRSSSLSLPPSPHLPPLMSPSPLSPSCPPFPRPSGVCRKFTGKRYPDMSIAGRWTEDGASSYNITAYGEFASAYPPLPLTHHCRAAWLLTHVPLVGCLKSAIRSRSKGALLRMISTGSSSTASWSSLPRWADPLLLSSPSYTCASSREARKFFRGAPLWCAKFLLVSLCRVALGWCRGCGG